jgi:hypothetical protein
MLVKKPTPIIEGTAQQHDNNNIIIIIMMYVDTTRIFQATTPRKPISLPSTSPSPPPSPFDFS